MFFVGVTHRSKKRAHSDVEADDRLSSKVLGNMRSNQRASGNQSVSNPVDAPRPFHQRQSSTQSSRAEFCSSVSRPLDASGLPSPVSTITTTPSYGTCERKNSTLIEIIHPSHEPAPQHSLVVDPKECENQEVNTAMTKQMILGVCEALHISTSTYHYL
jgi:hypothetical protein